MNKYEIYTRVNHESFENVPRLPVYLRSVGYKKLQNGTLEKSTELHSPFFEMCASPLGWTTFIKRLV